MKTTSKRVSLAAARAHVQALLRPQGLVLHVSPTGVPEVIDVARERALTDLRRKHVVPRYEPQDSEGGEL